MAVCGERRAPDAGAALPPAAVPVQRLRKGQPHRRPGGTPPVVALSRGPSGARGRRAVASGGSCSCVARYGGGSQSGAQRSVQSGINVVDNRDPRDT